MCYVFDPLWNQYTGFACSGFSLSSCSTRRSTLWDSSRTVVGTAQGRFLRIRVRLVFLCSVFLFYFLQNNLVFFLLQDIRSFFSVTAFSLSLAPLQGLISSDLRTVAFRGGRRPNLERDLLSYTIFL